MEDLMKDRIELLVDHIMKKCLWQFNSRLWDREKQNDNILMKTMQILCEEPVEKEEAADKCYWAEALTLVEAFRKRFSWLNTLDKAEIKNLIQGLKVRIDYLTISGSLNEELKDAHY